MARWRDGGLVRWWGGEIVDRGWWAGGMPEWRDGRMMG